MQPEDSQECLSPVKEGRVIFYNVGNENGDVDDAKKESYFIFKGSCVNELKDKLKEETGLDDVLVCCRNPVTAKLYPLRLQLPPNTCDMHVVLVPSSFQGQFFLYLFSLTFKSSNNTFSNTLLLHIFYYRLKFICSYQN